MHVRQDLVLPSFVLLHRLIEVVTVLQPLHLISKLELKSEVMWSEGACVTLRPAGL